MPVMIAASPVELGEHVAQDPQRAARRDLRDQIEQLECIRDELVDRAC